MGKTTNIEWATATWNPWHGCAKISPGCKNCYMFREKKRYGDDPTEILRSKTTFEDPLKWPDPERVFTCSWSDFFIREADPWRNEAWEIIRDTPHTYLILTKRQDRILQHLPADWGDGYPNVWLGVSVEDQDHIDRAWDLINIPAAVRWISAEPLIAPLTFVDPPVNYLSYLDWIVVGGESGSGARPMLPAWARNIRHEARAAGCAFFFKQGSQTAEWPDYKDFQSFPPILRTRDFPTPPEAEEP